MGRFIFWLLALGLFIYSAGFQAWIFWQLFCHHEITLCDYSSFYRSLELGWAISILLIAIAALIIYLKGISDVKRNS